MEKMIIIVLLIVAALLTLNLVSKKVVTYRAQKNAEQIFDGTFNGSPTATYRVSRTVGLSYGQVIAGAKNRGYDLQTQHKDTRKLTTLVFKKAV